MIGTHLALLPDVAEFFLLVRITLKDDATQQGFEEKGTVLRPTFEDNTNLNLIAAGRDVQGDNFYLNFWQMRSRVPTGEATGSQQSYVGGPNDLFDAMAIVHDIPQYGPVDDLVKVEDQDLMSSFLVQANEAWPGGEEDERRYYVFLEYDIPDSEAGTFGFNLQAYLDNFEREHNWDCIVTCFPMTGALNRYVQIFRMNARDDAAAIQSAQTAIAQIHWKKPAHYRVLIPAAYDPNAAAGTTIASSRMSHTPRAAAR